jgi:uncharacterized protein (TIGR02611 family)
MERLAHRWKKLPASIRKPVILVAGSLVILGGIILLPLPGPGWVIIFAGFAILATEFDQAQKIRDWFINLFKSAARWIQQRRQPENPKTTQSKH